MADVDKSASRPGGGFRRAIIFLGAPGAGKGTQAKEAAKARQAPHLSTGDMFRDHVGRGTDLGRQAKPIMERGELVPDEIVLGMVAERITRPDCANGCIFDGFPRTLPQAEKLDEMLDREGFGKPVVVHIKVNYDALVRRLMGRRTCKMCGEIYNIHDRAPKDAGRCDKDGGELLHRADDREDVIRERMANYDRQTRPLIDYYGAQGVLVDVDGMGTPEAVMKSVLGILARTP